MKTENKSLDIKILPSNFFVLRTPTFSYEKYNLIDHNICDFEDKLYISKLKIAFNDPIFKEAIYLSSPSLYFQLEKFINNEDLDKKDREKIILSLMKYFLRMVYRCTPFGLFAGISWGKIADKSLIYLKSSGFYKRSIRFDMNYLSSLYLYNLKKSSFRNLLKFYTNNTLYKVGNQLRYIEYRITNEGRTYHLVNVEDSYYVQKILSKAKSGATINELILEIDDKDINFEEKVSFVNEMIDSKLLTSELEPNVTGEKYEIQFLNFLNKNKVAENSKINFKELVLEFEKLKLYKLGLSIKNYTDIEEKVNEMDVEYKSGRLLQIDMYKPTEYADLGANIINELRKTINFLFNINQKNFDGRISKFKEAFYQRYEDREIPFLEVLDSEMGIGYPIEQKIYSDNSPLLRDLVFPKAEDSTRQTYKISNWEKVLLNKYYHCLRDEKQEIQLTQKDIIKDIINIENKSNIHGSKLPSSFFSLCSIFSSSIEELNNENFQIYHKFTSGPSCANLVGRFCYLNGELTNLIKDCLNEEKSENPDAIFAEIVHLPQGRIGNILQRPILRDYEIPILTRSSSDSNNTILLEDLFVSIKNNRIFLRSKKLNKEVIPRLTTAHNYVFNSLPQYQFLCDLQFQDGNNSVFWDWGVLEEMKFLPRVVFGKTILSRAKWKILVSDFKTSELLCENEFIKKFSIYKESNKIPSNIILIEGENELALNLDNIWCVKILFVELKKKEILVLEENLFTLQNIFVGDSEAKFTNEFIISLKSDNGQINRTNFIENFIEKKRESNKIVKQDFFPGSEWLYFKIYCGIETGDTILTKMIKSLTEKLLSLGKIEKWFFIRYSDPHHHIRLRFLLKEKYKEEIIDELHKLCEEYIKNNLVWKIKIDTYKREIERYGDLNINNSESIFFYDSKAVLDILNLLESNGNEDFRWVLAIIGVDAYLDDFNFDIKQKRDFTEIYSIAYKNEFNCNTKDFKQQLSSKFRQYKFDLKKILEDKVKLEHIYNIFNERSEKNKFCYSQILDLKNNGANIIPIENLLGSYIHMFLNRIFKFQQRLQEMVIYDLLYQHYKSEVSRGK